MAIVTSARRADFDLIHESSGLLEFFDLALTIEDYALPEEYEAKAKTIASTDDARATPLP